MYKVMIVDDDKFFREIISHLIEWEKTDFRIACCAKDADEALEMYYLQKPDLIITDIEMPKKNGLDLIKEIRKANKNQKFIIASSHASFNYAREAIKLDVTDYLIKDLITPHDMYTLLIKIKHDLIKRDMLLSSITDTSFQSSEEFISEYKHYGLKSIVFADQSEEENIEIVKKYLLNLYSNNYCIMCLQVDNYLNTATKLNYSEKNDIVKKITHLIYDILKSSAGGECFYNTQGEFIAIVGLNASKSSFKIISQCYEISNNIRNAIKATTNMSFTIGISSSFDTLYKINKKYNEAHELIKYKVFLGPSKTILYNTFNNNITASDTEIFNHRLKSILECIDNNDLDRIKKEISTLYNIDLKSLMQIDFLKYINSYLLNAIIILCNKYDIDNAKLFNSIYLPIEVIQAFETIDEISLWFIDIFTRIINFKIDHSKLSNNKRINDAIKYIRSNYTDCNLSLTSIAESLNIHKVYLCRIFKEALGETINNYILNLRVEKAKQELLTTDHKIYEVAQNSGFSSPQQFSIIFKKVTDQTPNKFRENI